MSQLEKRVFVAGGTGVLGRRVVVRLVERGYGVTAVARSEAKADTLRALGAQPIEVDLFDAAAVGAAVREHDVVMNLATSIPRGSSAARKKAWDVNHRIRREASANLVRAAAAGGATRFIQESITLLYADGGALPLDEHTQTVPTWITSSALDAERNCLRFGGSGGAAIVLRFGSFYGPDSHHTIDTIAMARKGRVLAVGPKTAYLSTITTDDAARATIAALDAPGGIYNVADDEPLTREEHFAALAAALGVGTLKHPPPFFGRLLGPKMAMLLRSHRVTSQKFKGVTDWRPLHESAWSGWRAVLAEPVGLPSPHLEMTR